MTSADRASGGPRGLRFDRRPRRRVLTVLLVFVAAAGLSLAQSTGDESRAAARPPTPAVAEVPSAELRDRFARFLFAPDAEAAILAETLIHEPPATLARLAERPAPETRKTAIVRVDGYDPPLACVVVLPAAPPPIGGYCSYFVFAGPMFGPEEFLLRSRMSAVLSAGHAVISPIEPTVWLPDPDTATAVAGRNAWRLAVLAAAAERVLPLDPSRRILTLGFPPSRGQDMEFAHAGTAFAAVHRVLPGNGEGFREDGWLDQGPRRFVFHCGPRRSESVARAIRRTALSAAALGGEVLSPIDPRIEHAPTARFDGSIAALAAENLAPNRSPATLAAVAMTKTGPSGGACVVCGVAGGRGTFRIAGFGSDRPTITAVAFDGDEPLQLELPIGGPPVDWTRPEAWIPSVRSAEPFFAACEGRLIAPDRARERLFAFRLSLRSGLPFVDSLRAKIQPRP